MRLSQRVGRISMSSTGAVFAAAAQLKAQGVDVVDLSAGEPDFPTPGHVKQAALEAIRDDFTRYTPTDGIPELKQAIVRRHARDFQSDYSTREVLVTVGGKHAIFNLTSALLQPGDEVVIPVPYWVTFKEAVHYAGAACLFVPTSESENFRVTADRIEAAVSPRTRLILLNSPNNPSGATIREAEMRKIAELARRRDLLVLTDECYCHFDYEGSTPFSLASLGKEFRDHVAVVGSVSKTYAMTGWRVGFCLGPEPLIRAMLKIQSHCTSNANSIAQKAAVAALDGPQDSIQTMLREYGRRRSFIVEALNSIDGISCNRPDGAFYVYPNLRGLLDARRVESPADLALQLLHEARVAVVPGEGFGTRDHIRLSYATSMEQLERGADRLARFFGT
ncbi:MAG: pyridoxal phosphate-dependent aminotransferase [Acidobacteria bacterium]|nr:pyridoxal phosphate-dependent aminotransferase [Acidobacteriota bacterium]